ncbi:MAG: hypothetical protein FWC58_05335 [Desulfobulbus sp.]|nr:hypothetical protein [Desulfobulbus sp.]
MQLTFTLGNGQFFGLALTIKGNRELACTPASLLIVPHGKPDGCAMLGFAIDKNLVSANAGNAGCVVSPQARANPDLMFEWGMTGEQGIAVGNGGGQRLFFSTVGSVGKRTNDFIALALNGDDPGVSSFQIVVDARDIAVL